MAEGRAIFQAKRALKMALTLLVLAALGLQVRRTWAALAARGEHLRIDGPRLALAVPLYLAGMALFGLYYARLLGAGPSPIGRFAAVRAYLISQLGKYVPGKAMVVVVRAGLSVQAGARAATAALTTLYETLMMMASGGLVAALGFALVPGRTVRVPLGRLGSVALPLAALGLIAGLGFLALVETRVFPRLSRLMTLPFPGVGPDALPTLSPRLLGLGLGIGSAGWVLLGLSQVAVILGLVPVELPWRAWPLVIASVALASVVGFAVPIAPGGLGVREWMLWTALGSTLDPDLAVVAALALRLVWVLAEALAAAVLGPVPAGTPSGPVES